MLKRKLIVHALLPLLAITSSYAAAPQSESSQEAARMVTYAKPNGDTYFALSLTPGKKIPRASSQDILVLVDTSASQTGPFREIAMESLKAMLAQLRPSDRVKLAAVDLNVIAMTQNFVGPTSSPMNDALGKLKRRTPLGSTDMAQALKAAVASFPADAANPRSVVYIGDGASRANLLGSQEMDRLLKELVKHRIAVSSFAVGPHRDIQLLATVANHTGGMLLMDRQDISAQQAGHRLAAIANESVLWPTSTKFPKAFTEIYPQQVPPLRADRDTILIGSIDGAGQHAIKVSALAAGKTIEMNWQLSSGQSNEDHTYLPRLVEMARANGGANLPTVGSAGLRESARVLLASAENLSKLGGLSLASGNTKAAAALAGEAIKIDPKNPQAQAVRSATQKIRRAEAGQPELRLAALQGSAADKQGAKSSLLDQFEPDQGSFLLETEKQKQVKEEMLKVEVERGLSDARGVMATDPRGAIQNLKMLKETVERTTDLDAEVRAQLRDRIVTAIREGQRRSVEKDDRDLLNRQKEAGARERQRILRETERQRDRLAQILARFDSLMDERRYQETFDLAVMAQEIEPDRPTPVAALWTSQLTGASRKYMEVRDRRHRRYMDTLLLVEESHVPFPDDPPIVYPDAEFWRKLTKSREQYKSVDLARTGDAEKKIFDALDSKTEVDFVETPLSEVIEYLKERHEINIEFDLKAMENLGVGSDSPVSRNLRDISLRSALRLILKELELTYTIQNEVLMITTPEQAETQLVTRVYPVADLVVPIQSGMMGMGGAMGSMGGMGGGGGGFGGGGGGGGFGGGGQGGGGFGGGGQGGGGFFNVPDQPAGRRGQDGGFRAFAVEDTLTLRTKAAPTVAKSSQSSSRSSRLSPAKAKPAKPRKIELEIPRGVSIDEAWERYFATHPKQSPADVRETVRQMRRAKKLDHVAAIIKAALRHGQSQPWMYEALGLAMQARHAPQEEIERTLMSAVDFSSNSEDIMVTAAYMARIGLEKRAISLFREVAAANPLRPEPYVQVLSAAQRVGDRKGVKWACLGTMNQAWLNKHQEVPARATRVAKSLYQQLLQEGRAKEAEQFKVELKQAMVRDCAVRVTWTGEADVDIFVEEPSGTICSLSNPRTSAGGVMLGDAAAVTDSASADGYSEQYICSQGFSGKYRLLIRRVWGKVTAGKVTVEIATNYGTKGQQYGRQQVTLGEKAHVIQFELDKGRRTEPMEEHLVANAAKVPLAMGRAILAQHLDGIDDSSAVHSLSSSRGLNRIDPRLLAGLAGRGAVGFRPELTILPEGASMSASAVISADRRYVRVTPAPMFSQIGDVTTFNFVTGEEGGDTGGGGGGLLGGGGGGGGVF